MGRSSSGDSFLGDGGFALFSKSVGLFLVLFTDLIEFLHVLEEFGASLKGNEKLCFLAISSVVGGLDSDRLGLDFLECGVVVPDQVLSSDHACGNSITKGVEFDCLVCLKVFFT